MYKITLINGDKEILLHHFSNDPEAPKILNAKGKFGFNVVPSVTIEVPITNSAFNSFYELLSHIKIEDHNGNEIFYGRMINPSDSFNNGISKTLIFEGELAYLNDTTIRPHEWHDYSVKDFLREILEEHNMQVEDYKKIYLGNVTVTGNLYRIADYENTLTLLLDRLPNRLGGFFILRKVKGKKYLDYLLNVGKVSNQEIVFGENMLDYQTECDTTGIYTKLIPLGVNKTDGTEKNKVGNKLTIKEVNNNKDYLINEEAAKIYGLIETTETWDDVTIASNLKRNGEEYLQEISKPRRSLKMKVADMHEIDFKYDKYNLGDEVPIKCKIFNVDERFRIIEIAIDFLNSLNTTYTFGNKFGTLTDNQLIIKNTQAKLDSFFNENGLISSYLEGTINLLNNNMRAMVESADRHNGTAILFECKVPGDLYGAMAIGTKGFMIADELNQDGTWRWRTFGTAKGFVADMIIAGSMIADRIKAGMLQSINKKTWINMDDGTFNLANKLRFDGNNFEIDLSGKDLATSKDISSLEKKIELKVSENDFGTVLEQNAYSVKIAWNKISNYVQFENGGLSIYNGSKTTSQKRAVFDERGNHFWRDGYYLGKIGTNQYTGDSSIKGFVFDLEADGGYMTWARKRYSSDNIYTMVWSYTNKEVGNYAAGKLHAGADIDMHYYYLRNVNFEGGGINGTLVFTQVVSMNSNGTAARWYNNSKLVFQNGILIDATWGNA